MRTWVFTALFFFSTAASTVHAEEVEKPSSSPCDGETKPGYTCTKDGTGTETTTGPDGTVTRTPNGHVAVVYPDGATAMWGKNPLPVPEEGKKSGCSMASSPGPLGKNTPLTPFGLVLSASIVLLWRRRPA